MAAHLSGFTDPTACWMWTGTRDQRGYGQISKGSHHIKAHRAAWEFFHGAIPASLQVLHACDNPPCINPAHLFLGTQHENVQDMLHKHRESHGEQRYNASLTEADVRAIRASDEPQTILAIRYGVTSPTISKIRARLRWRHIT